MKEEDGLQAGALVLLALISLVLLQLVLALMKRTDSDGLFPRGPSAKCLILGHLPLLRVRPHQVLADLCLKQGYGPILGLHLGSHRGVVVSSAALAKELLLTHDKAFANRVPYLLTDAVFYGYNTAVAFSSYNPRWVWMRKLLTLELLTAKRINQLSHVRQDEVRKLMHRLEEASGRGAHVVAVGMCLAKMTANTIARLLYSETLPEVASELPELIRAMEVVAFPTLGDFLPSCLRFLDVIPKQRMKQVHERLDKVFNAIVNERRRLMASCAPNELPNDFLQVILSKETISADEETITPREIKAIMLDILAASIHTSSATLEWAVAELLHNPECLLKLRDEVDLVTRDKEDIVGDDDVERMPYLENVMKEVLRLHPAIPLLAPRVSSIDCKVGKYFIPKGTQAVVNVWAIARDPQVWDKPECFYPERFAGKLDLDVRGQHYELLPFGAGRRMCPGVRLAMSVMKVTMANLVKFFEWELPHGETPSTMDMGENVYFTSSKKIPMRAIPKIRQCIPPVTIIQR